MEGISKIGQLLKIEHDDYDSIVNNLLDKLVHYSNCNVVFITKSLLRSVLISLLYSRINLYYEDDCLEKDTWSVKLIVNENDTRVCRIYNSTCYRYATDDMTAEQVTHLYMHITTETGNLRDADILENHYKTFQHHILPLIHQCNELCVIHQSQAHWNAICNPVR